MDHSYLDLNMIKFILVLCLLFSNTVYAKCFIKLNGKHSTMYLDVERVHTLEIKDKSWHTTNGPLIYIKYNDTIWDNLILYDSVEQANKDWSQMPMCIKG